MSNQNHAISIIRALTGHANLITIPREYVNYMGSLDGGLFLSQLIYWSDRSREWFYKTYDEWEAEISLTKYEISKQSRILKKRGILETKVMKANGAPTVHYRFSFDEFEKSFVNFLHYRKLTNLTNDSEESKQSLTKPTTKPTTKLILCKTCRENAVSKRGETCQQCNENKGERVARNKFATEVIEAWNSAFKEYPPVFHKTKGTIRISLAIDIRKKSITDRERGIRESLKKWYDDPGFRAHWKKSLETAAGTPGLLVQTWFDFEHWLKKKTANSDTPVYINCLNGKYEFLTDREVVQNLPDFEMPVTVAPGNPNF